MVSSLILGLALGWVCAIVLSRYWPSVAWVLGLGPALVTEAPPAAAAAALVDAAVSSAFSVPASANVSPIVVLSTRWRLPLPVAKQLTHCIDLIMRDFVVPWYRFDGGGAGISADGDFLVVTQHTLVNMVGQLAFRASHVNPLRYLIDDVSAALLAHLHWFNVMQRRAAVRAPHLFDDVGDRELLAAARARHYGGPGAAVPSTATALPSAGASGARAGGAAPASGTGANGGGSGGGAALPPLTEAERELVVAERRRREEEAERAILAEYAAQPGVLHPACDASEPPALLCAAPCPASAANSPPPWAAVLPPAAAARMSHCRALSEQMLLKLLPPGEGGARVEALLLRELLACRALEPLLSNGEPHTLNWLWLRLMGGEEVAAAAARGGKAGGAAPPPSAASPSRLPSPPAYHDDVAPATSGGNGAGRIRPTAAAALAASATNAAAAPEKKPFLKGAWGRLMRATGLRPPKPPSQAPTAVAAAASTASAATSAPPVNSPKAATARGGRGGVDLAADTLDMILAAVTPFSTFGAARTGTSSRRGPAPGAAWGNATAAVGARRDGAAGRSPALSPSGGSSRRSSRTPTTFSGGEESGGDRAAAIGRDDDEEEEEEDEEEEGDDAGEDTEDAGGRASDADVAGRDSRSPTSALLPAPSPPLPGAQLPPSTAASTPAFGASAAPPAASGPQRRALFTASLVESASLFGGTDELNSGAGVSQPQPHRGGAFASLPPPRPSASVPGAAPAAAAAVAAAASDRRPGWHAGVSTMTTRVVEGAMSALDAFNPSEDGARSGRSRTSSLTSLLSGVVGASLAPGGRTLPGDDGALPPPPPLGAAALPSGTALATAHRTLRMQSRKWKRERHRLAVVDRLEAAAAAGGRGGWSGAAPPVPPSGGAPRRRGSPDAVRATRVPSIDDSDASGLGAGGGADYDDGGDDLEERVAALQRAAADVSVTRSPLVAAAERSAAAAATRHAALMLGGLGPSSSVIVVGDYADDDGDAAVAGPPAGSGAEGDELLDAADARAALDPDGRPRLGAAAPSQRDDDAVEGTTDEDDEGRLDARAGASQPQPPRRAAPLSSALRALVTRLPRAEDRPAAASGADAPVTPPPQLLRARVVAALKVGAPRAGVPPRASPPLGAAAGSGVTSPRARGLEAAGAADTEFDDEAAPSRAGFPEIGSGRPPNGATQRHRVEYEIAVATAGLSWRVRARYSALHALHSRIKDRVPGARARAVCALFPSKERLRSVAWVRGLPGLRGSGGGAARAPATPEAPGRGSAPAARSASRGAGSRRAAVPDGGEFDPAFVGRRLRALDAWLQAALATREISESQEFREFLAPPLGAVVRRAARPRLEAPPPTPPAGRHVTFAVDSEPTRGAGTGGGAGSSATGATRPLSAVVAGRTVDAAATRRRSLSRVAAVVPAVRPSHAAHAGAVAAAAAPAPTPAPAAPRFLTAGEVMRAEAALFAVLDVAFRLQGQGWIRRQLIGTVRALARLAFHGAGSARRIGAAYHRAVSSSSIARAIRNARELMWPHGTLRVFEGVAPWGEQRATREAALQLLLRAPPPALATLLGRDATAEGLERVFASLQLPILARSLSYTLFDLLLLRLFPNMAVHGLGSGGGAADAGGAAAAAGSA